jgi:hypothetical protein
MDQPSADSLIGDRDPALNQKILDISEVQCVSQMQLDRMLDDHRREPIAVLAEDFHCKTLPAVAGPRPDVTSPSQPLATIDLGTPFEDTH